MRFVSWLYKSSASALFTFPFKLDFMRLFCSELREFGDDPLIRRELAKSTIDDALSL